MVLVSTKLLPKMCSPIRSVIYAADWEGKRDITDRCKWLWGMHPFTSFAFSENNRFVIVIIDMCSHRSCCRRYCRSSWLATVLSTSPESSKIWTPHRNWKTSRFICCAQFQPPPEHQTSKFACVNIVWDVKHYDDNANFPAWLIDNSDWWVIYSKVSETTSRDDLGYRFLVLLNDRFAECVAAWDLSHG